MLAERGARGLSFRAVAQHMGGSTTLVTHYFPTLKELLDEVTEQSLRKWDEEIRELDSEADDPLGRLRNLLTWLVPTTRIGLANERARINLLSGQILGGENFAMFEAWDAKIRGYLRSHLTDLIPHAAVERMVELLRVTTNGVVLSVVEHPDSWPTARQMAVVDGLLELLGLTEHAPAVPTASSQNGQNRTKPLTTL